jgi:hypothetical protein
MDQSTPDKKSIRKFGESANITDALTNLAASITGNQDEIDRQTSLQIRAAIAQARQAAGIPEHKVRATARILYSSLIAVHQSSNSLHDFRERLRVLYKAAADPEALRIALQEMLYQNDENLSLIAQQATQVLPVPIMTKYFERMDLNYCGLDRLAAYLRESIVRLERAQGKRFRDEEDLATYDLQHALHEIDEVAAVILERGEYAEELDLAAELTSYLQKSAGSEQTFSALVNLLRSIMNAGQHIASLLELILPYEQRFNIGEIAIEADALTYDERWEIEAEREFNPERGFKPRKPQHQPPHTALQLTAIDMPSFLVEVLDEQVTDYALKYGFNLHNPEVRNAIIQIIHSAYLEGVQTAGEIDSTKKAVIAIKDGLIKRNQIIAEVNAAIAEMQPTYRIYQQEPLTTYDYGINQNIYAKAREELDSVLLNPNLSYIKLLLDHYRHGPQIMQDIAWAIMADVLNLNPHADSITTTRALIELQNRTRIIRGKIATEILGVFDYQEDLNPLYIGPQHLENLAQECAKVVYKYQNETDLFVYANAQAEIMWALMRMEHPYPDLAIKSLAALFYEVLTAGYNWTRTSLQNTGVVTTEDKRWEIFQILPIDRNIDLHELILDSNQVNWAIQHGKRHLWQADTSTKVLDHRIPNVETLFGITRSLRSQARRTDENLTDAIHRLSNGIRAWRTYINTKTSLPLKLAANREQEKNIKQELRNYADVTIVNISKITLRNKSTIERQINQYQSVIDQAEALKTGLQEAQTNTLAAADVYAKYYQTRLYTELVNLDRQTSINYYRLRIGLIDGLFRILDINFTDPVMLASIDPRTELQRTLEFKRELAGGVNLPERIIEAIRSKSEFFKAHTYSLADATKNPGARRTYYQLIALLSSEEFEQFSRIMAQITREECISRIATLQTLVDLDFQRKMLETKDQQLSEWLTSRKYIALAAALGIPISDLNEEIKYRIQSMILPLDSHEVRQDKYLLQYRQIERLVERMRAVGIRNLRDVTFIPEDLETLLLIEEEKALSKGQVKTRRWHIYSSLLRMKDGPFFPRELLLGRPLDQVYTAMQQRVLIAEAMLKMPDLQTSLLVQEMDTNMHQRMQQKARLLNKLDRIQTTIETQETRIAQAETRFLRTMQSLDLAVIMPEES